MNCFEADSTGLASVDCGADSIAVDSLAVADCASAGGSEVVAEEFFADLKPELEGLSVEENF